jgi:hypothetical protein
MALVFKQLEIGNTDNNGVVLDLGLPGGFVAGSVQLWLAGFSLSYGDSDHHVRTVDVSVQLLQEFPGEGQVRVKGNCLMSDDSGNVGVGTVSFMAMVDAN